MKTLTRSPLPSLSQVEGQRALAAWVCEYIRDCNGGRWPVSTPQWRETAALAADLEIRITSAPMISDGWLLRQTVIAQKKKDPHATWAIICHEVAEAVQLYEAVPRYLRFRDATEANCHAVAVMVQKEYECFLRHMRAEEWRRVESKRMEYAHAEGRMP